MARPRRKRAEIDSALVSAERPFRHLLGMSGDFPAASREGTVRLVELVESLAQSMVLPQNDLSAEERLILQLSEQFVQRQLARLNQQDLKFASSRGLQAFFLVQLFERSRHEVAPSKRDQLERRANAAYFTPIGLSYYLVKIAFSSREIWREDSRVLDFCAGSGSLSIAALDYLSSISISSSSCLSAERLALLRRHIFAVEIDQLILRSYIACLAVACSATIEETRAAAAGNFSRADVLTANLPACEILLSNPPWEGSSYLRFVEHAGALLAPGGVAAMLTPAGIGSDQGAASLRRSLFEEFQWLSLEGFSNEDLAFAIHPSYKYALSIFSKPKQLEYRETKPPTRVRFGSLASNLLTSASRPWQDYSFSFAQMLSPGSYTIIESDSSDQFDLFKAIAENNASLYQLHEDGQMQMDRGRYKQEKKPTGLKAFSLRFARDFDMSIDKKLFIGSLEAKSAGFKPDCYGRFLQGKWIDVDVSQSKSPDALNDSSVIFSQDCSSYIERDRVEECLLPLIEGRMLSQFEIANKAYISGSGRQAMWRENEERLDSSASMSKQYLSSQYLVRESDFRQRRCFADSARVGFVSVSAATNTRSMVAALLPSFPTGNSVPFLTVAAVNESERAYWALIMAAVLNSFTFDFMLRTRFGGNNLNYFLLDQCSVPRQLLAAGQRDLADPLLNLIAQVSALLALTHFSLVPKVLAYLEGRLEPPGLFTTELGVITEKVRGHGSIQLPGSQRRRLLALLDALVARLYGLDCGQFARVLSGCSGVGSVAHCLEHSRGFHRVDKQLPFDQRLPYLAYQLFQDIEMNRLDLNYLAHYGFSAGAGSNGHGHSLSREQMAWLKMHQTRLDPFHQKSGVK